MSYVSIYSYFIKLTKIKQLKNGYIIKCIIEIKQWVWWAKSPESMGGYSYVIKHKNVMHPPVPLEAIGHLVYESSKLRLRAHI